MMSRGFEIRLAGAGLALAIFMVLLLPAAASARDSEHFYPVADVLESSEAPAELSSVPFYMKGAEQPAAQKKLGDVTSSWTTRGAFRSDEKSCRVAFMSAMLELQRQARAKGGDALVDVVSVTKSLETESPTTYRCVAGTTVVHVGLKATIVKTSEGDAPEGAAASPR